MPAVLPRPMTVFISSTSQDLKAFRRAVIDKVRELGHEVIAMEDVPARPMNGRESSLEQVGDAHVFIGLIGWRYGTILPGDTLSITEQEYRYAVERGIPALMFLGTPALRECIEQLDYDDAPKLQERFRATILNQHVKDDFDCDIEALLQKVQRALEEISRIPDLLDGFLAPPRRRNQRFVGRTRDLRALHELLYVSPVRRPSGWEGVRPVAIVGMPGMGKTSTAMEYVYTRYPSWSGGIFWLNGAQSQARGATLADTLTAEAARAATSLQLGVAWDAPDDVKARAFINRLNKSPLETLLVIDNVDHPQQLLRTMIGDKRIGELRCRVLITTRPHVSDQYDELILKQLDASEAITVLRRDLPAFSGAAERREMRVAKDICERLGHLPLALDLAARHLAHSRPKVTLSSFLTLIEERGAMYSLDKTRQDMGEDDREDDAQPGVRAAMWAGWNRLAVQQRSPTDAIDTGRAAQDALRVAACFPAAAALSYETLARASDPAAATSAHEGLAPPLLLGLHRLVDESLLEEWESGAYRLHPILREFARGEDVEADAAQRAAFTRRVAARYASALCMPRELDDILRASGGVNAALAEFRLATDLAHAARLAPTADTQRADGVVEPWETALAEWYHVLTRAADALFAASEEARPAPADTRDDADTLDTRITAPFWQHIHTAAVELGAEAVRDAARQWLGELRPRPMWLRLEQRVEGSHPALIRTFTQHAGAVNTLAWRPDGAAIASGGADRLIHIWSPESARELAQLRLDSRVTALAWRGARDSGKLAFASQDGFVLLWNTETDGAHGAAAESTHNPHHSQPVSALAWNRAGTALASGARDGSLCLWAVDADQPPDILQLGASIRALAWHRLDQWLACGSRDGAIHIIECAALRATADEPDEATPAHRGGVLALAWSPLGNWLASSGEDGVARLWTTTADTMIGVPRLAAAATLVGHDQPLRALAWSPDGKLLAGAGADGTLSLWEVDPGAPGAASARLVATISAAHAGAALALAWSPAGDILASAGEDGLARLWRVETARQVGPRANGVAPLVGHAQPISAASWGLAGGLLATIDGAADVGAWDAQTGRRLGGAEGPGETRAIAVSRDGRMIAAGGGYERFVRVWLAESLTQAEPAHTPDHTRDWKVVGMHQVSVQALAWNADNALLATAAENVLRIWDAAAPEPIQEPLWKCALHDDAIVALAWRPNAPMLATAGRDRTVRVWSIDISGDDDADEETEPRCVWWAPTPDAATRVGHYSALAWDAEGRTLTAGATDGTVRIWAPAPSASATRAPRLTIPAHRDAIVALAWRPGAPVLATAGRDRTVRLWSMPEGHLVATFYTYATPLALRWAGSPARLFVSDALGPPWRPRIYELTLANSDTNSE